MPCRCDDFDPRPVYVNPAHIKEQEKAREYKEEARYYKKEADLATELLCKACSKNHSLYFFGQLQKY